MPLFTHAKLVKLLFLIGCFFISSSQANAQQANVIQVEQFGQQGSPIVLIPGLMCDGSVWQQTVSHLQTTHQVFVINIAGFGKTPAVNDINLSLVEQAVADYIHQQQLENPVVIGHSLGGYLAMSLAVNPDVNLAGAVSVDGLPYIAPIFTRSNLTTVEAMRNQATQIKSMYQSMDQATLVTQTRYGIALQATAPASQQHILAMAEQSDPATVGQLMHDLLVNDLRKDLPSSQTPILLLGASGGFQTDEQHQMAKQLYAKQLSGSDLAQLKMNRTARHFIMYDDPTWFMQQIVEFIGE